jgi:hypothetical protein
LKETKNKKVLQDHTEPTLLHRTDSRLLMKNKEDVLHPFFFLTLKKILKNPLSISYF